MHTIIKSVVVDLGKLKDIKAALGLFTPERNMDFQEWVEKFEWACYAHGLEDTQMSKVIGVFLKGTAQHAYHCVPTHMRGDWTVLRDNLLQTYDRIVECNTARQETSATSDHLPEEAIGHAVYDDRTRLFYDPRSDTYYILGTTPFRS